MNPVTPGTPPAIGARAEGGDISKWDVSFHPENLPTPPKFICQRASYGMIKDQLFDQLNVGVQFIPVRGAYHYLSSAVGWKLQADWFLNIVQGRGFHFYVCDFEGAFNQLSIAFVAEAIEWMRYVKALTGKQVLIYSNISTYNNYLAKDSRTKEFPLWIAWPPTPIPDPQTANPSLPASRSDWVFWQYSFGEHNTFGPAYGTGRAGCDLDVFNGTFEELCQRFSVTDAHVTPLPAHDEMHRILWEGARRAGWILE